MNLKALFSSKTAFQGVTLYDCDNNTGWKAYGNSLVETSVYDLQALQAAIIYPKDMISSSLTIDHTIPQDQWGEMVSFQAYEELSLDEEAQYTFGWRHARMLENGDAQVDVFVVANESLQKRFAPFKATGGKALDYIVYAPLLFEALYVKSLTPQGAHLFITIAQSDAFLTIYRNGEYVYCKSIKYSLDYLYDKFCDYTGNKPDKGDFTGILLSQALDPEFGHYTFFSNLFQELFMGLNDILIYARRVYGVGELNAVYMGTIIGNIDGIEKFTHEHFGMEVLPFSFDVEVKHSSLLLNLLLLRGQEIVISGEVPTECNFTIFPRPPHFLGRDSGKFLLSLVAGVMVAIVVPMGSVVQGFMLKYANITLTAENAKFKTQADEMSGRKSALENEINALKEAQTKLSGTLSERNALLDETLHTVSNYKRRSVVLAQIGAALQKHKVKAVEIRFDDDRAQIIAIASKERAITNLLGAMVASKHFSGVFTKSIIRDANTSQYISTVEVKF